MSDAYEMTLSVWLPGPLATDELAELTWHLGLGAAPDVPGGPDPLLAHCGALTEAADGWTLTAHRELGTGEFDGLSPLLRRLATRTGVQGPVVVGQLRSRGSEIAEPLVVRRDTVEWPARPGAPGQRQV
ncbi:hypothetical protein [Kitasatospora sp. NPDC088346]|uniref:hypothetical protein n=1 Tax=Kitasatospora sp. NPDC088346 TaxID=3364073 RepID=UPI00380513C6